MANCWRPTVRWLNPVTVRYLKQVECHPWRPPTETSGRVRNLRTPFSQLPDLAPPAWTLISNLSGTICVFCWYSELSLPDEIVRNRRAAPFLGIFDLAKKCLTINFAVVQLNDTSIPLHVFLLSWQSQIAPAL